MQRRTEGGFYQPFEPDSSREDEGTFSGKREVLDAGDDEKDGDKGKPFQVLLQWSPPLEDAILAS